MEQAVRALDGTMPARPLRSSTNSRRDLIAGRPRIYNYARAHAVSLACVALTMAASLLRRCFTWNRGAKGRVISVASGLGDTSWVSTRTVEALVSWPSGAFPGCDRAPQTAFRNAAADIRRPAKRGHKLNFWARRPS